MKRTCIAFVFLVSATMAFCQVTDAEKQLKTQKEDTVLGWKKGGVININTAQTSLTNWAAGGESSVAIGGLLNLFANNKEAKSLWENYLEVGYGTLKQGKDNGWRKTDDKIDFTSKYGLKAADKFYYAALLNFKTQMANGYNYPNDSVKISSFMSPGYLLLALGIDYKPRDNFGLFFAPLTLKLTFVMDDTLAAHGAFGVDPGKNVKSEFGGYLRVFYTQNLMENITLQTKLDLFSNYLHNPQNIDVNWEVLISMKVNKFISATLSTQLLYDDDVVITRVKDNGTKETFKSKVQFKEVLAAGLSIKF